ncbi:MAG TPA: PIN domain nuclease [Woeseiaceae bacterium]|nr:PIN domain nuclease [Woeseiaceae bacterium]
MILVDTSVWVDYFNGAKNRHSDYLDRLLGVEPVAIGDLMLAEVLQGFRSDAGYREAKSLLLNLTVLEMVTAERAVRAADNYRFLRKRAVTVRKTMDTLIATFCIDRDIPLLFSDRDFEPFVQHLNLRRG